MKEIKFRARTLRDKKWVYGHYFITPLTDEDSGVAVDFGWSFLSDGKVRHCIANENGAVFVIDQYTLGQYISLKDKNGKKIYEGDILEMTVSKGGIPDESGEFEEQDIYAEIYFSNGCFWFKGNNRRDCNWHFYNEADREVIGNIYENPELLHAQNQ